MGQKLLNIDHYMLFCYVRNRDKLWLAITPRTVLSLETGQIGFSLEARVHVKLNERGRELRCLLP